MSDVEMTSLAIAKKEMAFWEYAFLVFLISSELRRERDAHVLVCLVLNLSASLSAGVSAAVFQISPSNVTGLNGAELGISCYADNNPSEVRWTKDGIAVFQSSTLQTAYADGMGSITFTPLGYQHEGVYRCTAYDSAGVELFSSYPGRVRAYGESRHRHG